MGGVGLWRSLGLVGRRQDGNNPDTNESAHQASLPPALATTAGMDRAATNCYVNLTEAAKL
jgi:hypothetical protein